MKTKIRGMWPWMDQDVAHFVKTCFPCQLVGMPQCSEPIKTIDLPNGP